VLDVGKMSGGLGGGLCGVGGILASNFYLICCVK
jgi:hypothetical protein